MAGFAAPARSVCNSAAEMSGLAVLFRDAPGQAGVAARAYDQKVRIADQFVHIEDLDVLGEEVCFHVPA